MHSHHIGRAANTRDHLEIAQRVVGRIGVQRGIHRERRAGHQQGIAISGRFCDQTDTDIRARTRAVIHHHRLTKAIGQFGSHDSRDDVGSTARCEGHNNA